MASMALGQKDKLVSPPCSYAEGVAAILGGSPVELSVQGTFAGATVFLTGGTGFLGSVVLEQLLRVCPAVKKVYLLIRVKHGQSGQQRLRQLLQKRLFRLHWEKGASEPPESLPAKLAAVPGDISAAGLRLSDADRQRLASEVDIVIHCAASISFFDPVHTLLEQNYLATRETAALAGEMRRLRGFVHVSTAYVKHLPRGCHVEERIYPLTRADGSALRHAELAAQLAPLPPAKAAKLARSAAAGVLRDVGLPNCYTLTKHMAEELLDGLHCAAFPVAIVRPTIIGALAGAPLPGYFGNAAGVTAAALAYSLGMARFSCHDPFNVYDIIPADLSAAAVLASVAAMQQERVAAAPRALVVHSGSSCTHPFCYWDMYVQVMHPFWAANPAPADRRLTAKRYKPPEHPTLFVPEHSLIFKAMSVKHGLRVRLAACGLRLAGHAKVSALLLASWRVWKLYNTSTMDFHLFYCGRNLQELQAHLKKSERAALQLVWGPEEDWAAYLTTHFHQIRAKYYPSTLAQPAAAPELKP